MKGGGKIIKQAYSSLKNNFVPQQPNKESLTTNNSIKFQTIERIPNKYGNNKKKNRNSLFGIFSIIFVVKVAKVNAKTR